ncbi:MAG: M28 family peptidase [Deltaproteobacteria bacterium]|jgi:Zn-dependent M28 family amino/carboxypeptidase|nr:M28 family peptidase [Deltaproteobacteria bacterium]MBW2543230.1 M28 family peptidase [Deltaproteobacteria bacterium]
MYPEVSGARSSTPNRAAAPTLLALLAFALSTSGLGCGARPAPDSASAERAGADVGAVSANGSPARIASFSADRAWRDLQALTDIGARPVGSSGNDRARDYLSAQLEDLGVEVESREVDYASAAGRPSGATAPEIRVTNLSAVIPGTRSQDRFVLAAPFDSRQFEDFEFIGANDGASGAAVVLEIARVLAAHPLPYATEIAFLDGEAPFSSPNGRHRPYREIGSLGLASRIRESGSSGVRLLVYLNRVGDADLRIARDLVSHRIYREEFWKAASALDRTRAFPPDAAFENAGIAHQYFVQIGLRQVVSIVDTSFGGDQPPGLYAGTAQDTIDRCSPDSLETVGVVVLEALDAISQRLGKIDRFAAGRSGEVDTR